MEERQYFILKKVKKHGPYTFDELLKQNLNPKTEIWHPGLNKWQRAETIPELFEFFDSIPPVKNRKQFFYLVGIPVLILILATAYGLKSGFFLSSSHSQINNDTILNNQEIYSKYGPGVVLIEHKFIYEITAGSKKFYFNQFSIYKDYCYLEGLTDKRITAEENAEPLQGTGFFISNDGKILTNRHVILKNPSKKEQILIDSAFIQSLTENADEDNAARKYEATVQEQDSTLKELLKDSSANAVRIAALKEEISKLDYNDEDEGPGNILIDSAEITKLQSAPFTVRKITLELKVFKPGSKYVDYEGINCNISDVPSEENMDLALIQVKNRELPDANIKLPSLTRISSLRSENSVPQMSERLIMIGYNEGTFLSNTLDGIKSQLTEGRISQNTDQYKLLYTIPSLPGSSGSPVLDERGQLVSVNFEGLMQTQSFNYGIHPEIIREYLKRNNILN